MEKKKRKRSQKWKTVSEMPPRLLSKFMSDNPVPVPSAVPDDFAKSATAAPKITRYRVEKWRQFHTPNPAMLRHTLVAEGYHVYQWSDRPGTIYRMHKHESQQSHWIISGSLEITVEGRATNILGPGDRDHMPANTYHSARVIGDEPVIYLVGEIIGKNVDREGD